MVMCKGARHLVRMSYVRCWEECTLQEALLLKYHGGEGRVKVLWKRGKGNGVRLRDGDN